MDIDAVIARLKATITDLRTVDPLATLSALMERGALPEQTPAAYVMPSSLIGKAPNIMTGLYEQPTEARLSVVLVVRGNDPKGRNALDKINDLLTSIIAAIAGWQLVTGGPQFEFVRWQLASSGKGAFTYAIDFKITDKLRIAS